MAPNLPECLILVGLPASGKTRRAMEWVAEDPTNRERINYDDLRLELYGPNWNWNRSDEAKMKLTAVERCNAALRGGKSVVIDNTNLTPKARQIWRDIATAHGAAIIEEEIDTPVEECVRRDAKREGRARVGRAVIDRMALFNGFLDFSDREVYPRDFIIVDMDGTLANCDARRKRAFGGPTRHKLGCESQVFDRQCPECGGKANRNWGIFYDGCENDPPIAPIVDLVTMLHCWWPWFNVIVVSGRPIDKAGKATEAWLIKNLPVRVRHLFMRQGGDSRPDFIVKEEILDLLPKERIKYVLDDRDQVVEMWRKHGLTCLQVADGKF